MENFETNKEKEQVIDDIYNFSEPDKKYISNALGAAKSTLTKRGQEVDTLTRWATVLLAVFVFFFGISYVKKSIGKPFLRYKNTSGQTLDLLSYTGQTEALDAEQELLRNSDSDADGISDYDELNVYQTSPYLEDSNSNGKTDLEDIQAGNDPNCLTGGNCGSYEPSSIANDADDFQAVVDPAPVLPGAGSDIFGPLLGSLNEQQIGQLLGTIDIPEPESQLDSLQQLDSEQLRQFLLTQGIDPTLLDNVSDSELRSLVDETLQAVNQ